MRDNSKEYFSLTKIFLKKQTPGISFASMASFWKDWNSETLKSRSFTKLFIQSEIHGRLERKELLNPEIFGMTSA